MAQTVFTTPEHEALKLLRSFHSNYEAARARALALRDNAIAETNYKYWAQIAEALRPKPNQA